MGNNFLIFSIFFLFSLFLPTKTFSQSVREYYWWDGDQKRVINIVENVLVEVPNVEIKVTGGTFAQQKMTSVQKLNEKIKRLPSVFKVEKTEGAGHFAKIYVRSNNFHEDIKQDLGGQFSPLFQDGPSGKALAGGVIITFKENKSDEEVKTWAESKGVKIKEKMGIVNGRTWLVESSAGLVSLDLANQLHESPDIEFSQPNWAHDFSSRHFVPRKIKTIIPKKTSKSKT
jgi:hypothetical protein